MPFIRSFRNFSLHTLTVQLSCIYKKWRIVLLRKVKRLFSWQTDAVTVNTFSLGIKEIPLLQLKNTNPSSMYEKMSNILEREAFPVQSDLSRNVKCPFNWQNGNGNRKCFLFLGIKEIPLLQLKNTSPSSMKGKMRYIFERRFQQVVKYYCTTRIIWLSIKNCCSLTSSKTPFLCIKTVSRQIWLSVLFEALTFERKLWDFG